MARHRWNRAKHGPRPATATDAKSKWAALFCVLFALVGAAFAVSFFANPTHCDGKPMQPEDRCYAPRSILSKGYTETLRKPPPPLPYTLPDPHLPGIDLNAEGRTLDEQRVANRKQGLLGTGSALFFFACATPFIGDMIRSRRASVSRAQPRTKPDD